MVMIGIITFLTSVVRAEEIETPDASQKAKEEAKEEAKQDIEFMLKPTYKIGEKIEFKIHNNSKITYAYNQKYPACDLFYFDSTEREFMIPQATHCDMVVTVAIKPGETKTLFDWNGDECIVDQFGCSKKEPLPIGTYTIRGTFTTSADENVSTESVATIELIK
jgi:hypothetical protein